MVSKLKKDNDVGCGSVLELQIANTKPISNMYMSSVHVIPMGTGVNSELEDHIG